MSSVEYESNPHLSVLIFEVSHANRCAFYYSIGWFNNLNFIVTFMNNVYENVIPCLHLVSYAFLLLDQDILVKEIQNLDFLQYTFNVSFFVTFCDKWTSFDECHTGKVVERGETYNKWTNQSQVWEKVC